MARNPYTHTEPIVQAICVYGHVSKGTWRVNPRLDGGFCVKNPNNNHMNNTFIQFINKNKPYIIILFIIAIFFYWYGLRPAQIKKECSWTKVIVSAQQAITEAQVAEAQKEYDDCLSKEKIKTGNISKFGCIRFGPEYVRDYTPERTYYREATKTEYDFCIHSKGL